MEPDPVGHWRGQSPAMTPVQPRTGIVHGIHILTLDGMLPVEFLSPGDRVIARDAGMVRLLGVESFEASFRPVRVRRGALGSDCPEEESLLHPAQPVLLRDWRAKALFGASRALARAEDLVDGEFICRSESTRHFRLSQLVFERDEVIYANGMELGSHTAQARPLAPLSPAALAFR